MKLRQKNVLIRAMEWKSTGKDSRTQKEEERPTCPTKGGERVKHKIVLE